MPHDGEGLPRVGQPLSTDPKKRQVISGSGCEHS